MNNRDPNIKDITNIKCLAFDETPCQALYDKPCITGKLVQSQTVMMESV